MKHLDKILGLLRDKQWHSIEKVKKETLIQDENLNEILSILQKQSLINKENERIRITPLGLKFLELPY